MIKLTGSVGKNGDNVLDDVKKVQVLLNKHGPTAGFAKLGVDGKVGTNTLKAIVLFQKAIGMKSPDGVVDPGGRTLKALEDKPVAKPAEDAKKEAPTKPNGNGRISGNLSGVGNDIVAYATAVAQFYGREIRISSGKRDAAKQAQVMFDYWTTNLERGSIYRFLKSNSATREQLDEWYAMAAEGKAADSAAAADAKKKFLNMCAALAPKLSLHVAGRAIDVSPKSCMTGAMRAAMKVAFKEVDEKTCLHYESGSAVPAPTDAVKKQWAAP